MLSTFTAFFDSNVFFGARLRSVVLTLAQTGLFRARWSDDVHREWIRAVVGSRPELDPTALDNTRSAMDRTVLDAKVAGYENLIEGLALPDPDDRHILAAAIKARASVIVTFNLSDFPVDTLAKWDLHARHPDQFLMDLYSLDDGAFVSAIAADLRRAKKPPLSINDYALQLQKAGCQRCAELLLQLQTLFESLETEN